MSETVDVFVCGDVMIGRGVDARIVNLENGPECERAPPLGARVVASGAGLDVVPG